MTNNTKLEKQNESKINTVVFDLGNVIFKYQPESDLQRHFTPEISRRLYEALFNTELWQEFDRGTESEESLLAKVIARHPDLESELTRAMALYYDFLSPLSETWEVILSLKERNYSLYILSNISVKAYEVLAQLHDIFDNFDGKILSAEVRINKPDPAIFKCIIDKYNLTPAKTLYIDDLGENIAAAKEMGFKTTHLTRSEEIKKTFIKHGIIL